MINVLGVRVDPLSVDTLHQRMASIIGRDERALILNVNVHGLNLAYSQPSLRHFFNSAEMVFCDGVGVVLGARILGYRLPRRITYADWMWELSAFAEPRGYTCFFLGARPGITQEAARRLKERHPRLRVVGTHHGYFDKTVGSLENETVIQTINALRPNILIVGFGMPRQELWLMENWRRIDANVLLTGGGIFDILSGNLRRGPRWMTDHGFEWLARLIIEPRRLWRRYVIGNPLFIYRVVKQRIGLPLEHGEHRRRLLRDPASPIPK